MLISTSNLTIKKSKFIGYLIGLNSVEKINLVLKKYEKEHKKATHLCVGILFETYEKFKNKSKITLLDFWSFLRIFNFYKN